MALFTRVQHFPWSKIKTLKSPAFREDTSSEEDRDSIQGLLEKQGDGNLDRFSQPQSIWRNRQFLAGHAALLSLYLLILTLVAMSKDACPRSSGKPVSPAMQAVEYRDTLFTLEDHITDDGLYSGKPSPELDKAWHDLLNGQNIRIEPEYFEHYGREKMGVAIPEGGGFIGTLNVFHELHCLKRLHQYMYPDYYFPDFTPHQLELNRKHNEHCLDFLRQSAMCHGDVGLITYVWRPDSLRPVVNATSHQCVNWEKLYGWTQERAVDMMKPGWLVHPTKGPAYPNGEGGRIGAIGESDGHGAIDHGH